MFTIDQNQCMILLKEWLLVGVGSEPGTEGGEGELEHPDPSLTAVRSRHSVSHMHTRH